jgi:hypothetical protein
VRNIIPDGDDLGSLLKQDAEDRLFSPEAVARFLAQENEHDALNSLADAMTFDPLPATMDGGGAAVTLDEEDEYTEDDAMRLRDEMAAARREQPRMREPNIVFSDTEQYESTAQAVATWMETPTSHVPLTHGQYSAYVLLQHAGEKQLITFLSGEGGVGKSTLTRLLVKWWKSQGLRVIVLASSAKARHCPPGHMLRCTPACPLTSKMPAGSSAHIRHWHSQEQRMLLRHCLHSCSGRATHRRSHRALCLSSRLQRRFLRASPRRPAGV